MSPPELTLSSEVKYLKGVGPRRAALLAERGVRMVADLLDYPPFRYEDRTNVTRIRDLLPGQITTVLGKVIAAGLNRTRRGTFIYELSAADASRPGSGGIIYCLWFNGYYLEKNKVFQPGQLVFFYGKAERDHYRGERLQMIQPQFEIVAEEETVNARSLEVGRVVPIYEAIGALGPKAIRRLMWTALEGLGGRISDPLPASVRGRCKLAGRASALRLMHFPDAEKIEELNAFRSPSQIRLIFEELFHLGARLALRRQKMRAAQGIPFEISPSVREQIKQILPFHPTAAQKRVLGEIAADMHSQRPMNRLLQGDVGSGKTIVAVQAAIIALANGHQVALMAPTEILATQHYLYLRRLLEPLPYGVELLISGCKASEKAETKRRLAEGSAHVVVGTHALLEKDVRFRSLGLAIIDEQHRFGVMHRYGLIRKGPQPDVLVMTATPIPRTLALTLYGELDFSVIDEMPPHRAPIETRLLGEPDRERAFDFIRARVKTGGQAYVVYPIIEESQKLDLRPAVRMFEQLARNVFPQYRVGLLHGRLASAEKEAVMLGFRRGDIHILVSTTVVEVGVDVPNATVMLIEHAERFGLSQLHQLRGRIGRGTGKSYCLLLASDRRNEISDERLRIMTETTDGFKIAEMDLRLRGPGEFFGTRQSGVPAFRFAKLLRDQEILDWARREAAEFIEHPASRDELDAYLHFLHAEWPRRYGLVRVG